LALTDFEQSWIDRRRAPGLTIRYEDTSLYAIVRPARRSSPVDTWIRSPVLVKASESVAATARGNSVREFGLVIRSVRLPW
jgi:hypothetical protein